MREIVGNVLMGLSLVLVAGLAVALYVAWRDRRRAADAAFLAPIETDQTVQTGGPKEPA